MHVEPHRTPDQLADLIRAETHARVARRLGAVRLALLGQAADAIAAHVLLSGRQVRTWVGRYNAGGPDALADRPGRGRHGPLTPDQEQRLAGSLSRLYGRPMSLQVELDESLLGGLVVRVGGEVIDGSVAGRIEAARRHLPR